MISIEYLVVLSSVAGLLVSGNPAQKQIKLVAVADGKSFFAEHTPYRDWAAASAYCKTYGMQLASITSRAQFNALNASYSNDFKQDFWTSGRDALAPNQFAWNSTDIAATADAIDYRRDRSVSARTCLLFFSDPQESYTYSLRQKTSTMATTLVKTERYFKICSAQPTHLNMQVTMEYSVPQLPKYLVLNHFGTPQAVLHESFQNLARKRDYYKTPSHPVRLFGPTFITFKIIADVLNSTLVTEGFVKKYNLSEGEYTNIYPFVWLFPGAPYFLSNLNKTYTFFKNTAASDVRFISRPGFDFNFVYCGHPKLATQMPWDFKTLTFALHSVVWFVLILTTFSVYLGLYCTEWIRMKMHTDTSTKEKLAFAVIGSILPEGFDLPKSLRKVGILYLWRFICFILCNHYSAKFASIMIIPPKEESISYISHFDDDFQLTMDSSEALHIVNSSISYSLARTSTTKTELAKLDIIRLGKLLKHVNTKNVLKYGLYHTGGKEEFANMLAFQKKVVSVNLWHHAVRQLSQVNEYLFGLELKKPVHCYLGKQLIKSGNIFHIYIPPAGKLVGMVVQRVTESGIFDYWDSESVALTHSDRLQERYRIVSKTKYRYKFESANTAPLKMDGKISSVFFLWGLLCTAAFIQFVRECAFINTFYFCTLKCFSVVFRSVESIMLSLRQLKYHNKLTNPNPQYYIAMLRRNPPRNTKLVR